MNRLLFFLSSLLLFSACSESTVYTIGNICGTAIDAETGDPLPDCDIALSPLKLSTTTENDGTFLFPNIEKGQYAVRASKTGYVPDSKDLTVISGQNSRVDFQLHRQPATKGTVCGTIADAGTGLPLSKCKVLLQPDEISTTTTSDGSYLFSDLEPGEYTLLVSKDKYEADSRSGITVEAGETATVDFLLQEERLPEISRPTVSGITQFAAKFESSISDEGSSPVTECGFIYGFSPESLTIDSDGKIRTLKDNTTGQFSVNLNALQIQCQYYVVAYAINAAGVSYSAHTAFTTAERGPANVIYVSQTGDDRNDGLSWISAKQTIAYALSIAPEDTEIWVSSTGFTSSDFNIPNGVSIYGGFTGVETKKEGRTQKTAIRNLITLIDGPKTSIIDGFLISTGTSPGNAIITLQTNGVLRNCEVQNNYGRVVNGGRVENCIFTNNQSWFDDDRQAKAAFATNSTFVNCVFYDNRYWSKPAGDFPDASYINCLLVNNRNLYMATAYNCTIVNNDYVSIESAYNTILWNNQTFEVSNTENCHITYEDDNSAVRFANPNPTTGPEPFPYPSWTTWDWSLSPESVCIDTGNAGNYPIDGAPTDLAGNPRISNGSIDIGAYEYQH